MLDSTRVQQIADSLRALYGVTGCLIPDTHANLEDVIIQIGKSVFAVTEHNGETILAFNKPLQNAMLLEHGKWYIFTQEGEVFHVNAVAGKSELMPKMVCKDGVFLTV